VIIMLRWSRQNFSIGRSVVSPTPPWMVRQRSAAMKDWASPKI
jgi:hypothetical protein